MDKSDLLSKIGYLKSEVYKPSLRPYVTALVDVCDALEALLQEVFKPTVDGLTIHRGTDTGMKRRSASTPDDDPEGRNNARRMKAERQARWRAKRKAKGAETGPLLDKVEVSRLSPLGKKVAGP